jgi:hypothetical protein
MGYFQAGSLLGSRASALELPGGAAQDGLITVPDFKAPTD